MTKQLDATMYGDSGGKLPIRNMHDPITMVVERMRSKDPTMVLIPGIFLLKLFTQALRKKISLRV